MSGVPEERPVGASAVTEAASESVADEVGAEDEDEAEDIRAHLTDVEDGCGCAEVWEHLSSGRGE